MVPNVTNLVVTAENLKKVSAKFQEEYNSIKKLRESNAELLTLSEKESKSAEVGKSIEDGLASKYKQMLE